jgi:hypothetical protein
LAQGLKELSSEVFGKNSISKNEAASEENFINSLPKQPHKPKPLTLTRFSNGKSSYLKMGSFPT